MSLPTPHYVRLDMSAPLNAFIGEIKALNLAGDAEELDYVIGRHVSDIYSHLYDKCSACGAIEAYAGDCVEGVYAAKVGEEPSATESDLAYRYGRAIVTLGVTAFEQLNALGAYNSDDVLPFSFEDFVGKDVLIQYLPMQP